MVITTVVVGEKKSVWGDDPARATITKAYDSIFERGVLLRVDLFGGEFTACSFHLNGTGLFEAVRKPHSFFGSGVGKGERKC